MAFIYIFLNLLMLVFLCLFVGNVFAKRPWILRNSCEAMILQNGCFANGKGVCEKRYCLFEQMALTEEMQSTKKSLYFDFVGKCDHFADIAILKGVFFLNGFIALCFRAYK